jgi:porin
VYPKLYAAGRLDYSMDNGRYLQTAYTSNPDTTPNDTMLTIEYGRSFEGNASGLRKYALGVWYFTNSKTTDAGGNPVSATHNQGIYGLIETALTREADSETQGLNGFLRYGIADTKLNQFAGYLGAGIVYTGLLSGRDEDQVGLAIAMVSNSDTYKAANVSAADSETSIELSYRFQVKPWLTIQPDLQYVVNPGADKSKSDATYFALRATIAI